MNQLRITGGYLKGRKIATLKGAFARYSSSKLREAVFNLIGDVTGKRVLDLYAGSGSFSFEAISRGAKEATCVEISGEMAGLLRNNAALLSVNKYCQVLCMDVRYAIPFLHGKRSIYDIIFMDPPYEKGHIGETMRLLSAHAVYDQKTTILLEYSKRETLDPSCREKLIEVTTRRYGDTVITILETGTGS
ncbi:MAG TPA: 16S rRNA (guanine(966)-N(2))-methyltransferase RsmD [Syntrophorhabdaceae bacterium]|nr:16S rRNA (guanine(966)-N(2))-methyltransferase RsmD [Syntrophorhabdaceae bacterium]HQM82918.1 16S rRNA (guanine(966)-N(2))-methyltransferase RsmD [Syntrophorhabdaceae bacterium]